MDRYGSDKVAKAIEWISIGMVVCGGLFLAIVVNVANILHITW